MSWMALLSLVGAEVDQEEKTQRDRPVLDQERPQPTPALRGEGPEDRPWIGFGPGHGHLYARLGQHSAIAEDMKFGPTLGIGYRFELDRLILDVSSLNFYFWRESQRDSYRATWNSYLRLMAFRYLDDFGLGDLYAGAGLSYGELRPGQKLRGEGMQGEIGIGYEFLRSSAVRAFIQAGATLPFYSLYSERHVHPSASLEISRYGWSAATSIGLGF